MTMTATPSTVPAGNVTFIVKNTGTIDHEAVVLKLDRRPDLGQAARRRRR